MHKLYKLYVPKFLILLLLNIFENFYKPSMHLTDFIVIRAIRIHLGLYAIVNNFLSN